MKNFLPNKYIVFLINTYSELVKAHLWVSHSVQETITATARFIIAALTFVIVHLDPDQLTIRGKAHKKEVEPNR